jgi:hypothetical protein
MESRDHFDEGLATLDPTPTGIDENRIIYTFVRGGAAEQGDRHPDGAGRQPEPGVAAGSERRGGAGGGGNRPGLRSLHDGDWIDFHQLFYLCDPEIILVTDDNTLLKRVGKSSQKNQILLFRDFLTQLEFPPNH